MAIGHYDRGTDDSYTLHTTSPEPASDRGCWCAAFVLGYPRKQS